MLVGTNSRERPIDKKNKTAAIVPAERIARSILVLRGHKVLLDFDLAALYEIETRALVQAVKRNLERFPKNFMFQMTSQELAAWRSQIVMSNPGAKMGLRRPPFAFTEHGALMAATVLNSPRAVEMSLYVVRAFVRMREVLATHNELTRKLAALERRIDSQDETIVEILAAIRQLMTPPEPKRRPIGFVIPKEK